LGVAPTHAELEAYAKRLGLPVVPDATASVVALEASGYVRSTAGDAYLICDCAAVGPDYQPGHAHADTLSFELSLGAQRVFVNSGTSKYGADVERQRQRSTAAHNTVVVDDQNSSEVWAGFRVARRAYAKLHAVTSTSPLVVDASHDGYRRLPGRNIHRRKWILDERSLTIEDEVSGRFCSAEARFHLHSAVSVKVESRNEVLLSWPGSSVSRMNFENAAAVELQPGAWHPEFGVSVPNYCITARFSGAFLKTQVYWSK